MMVRTLAGGLAAAGVETHVATTDDDGESRVDVQTSTPIVENGVTYWYFPRQTRFYTVSAPAASWLSSNVANYDVVHIHALFSYLSVAGGFVANWRKVPYVLRPLGVLNGWGMKNRRRRLKDFSFRHVESRLLQKAAFVHFTSEQERDEALLLNVSFRWKVIPNPTPELLNPLPFRGRFRAENPELQNRPLILFLSRIDVKKGLDLLLTSFAKTHAICANAALVIGGDGDPELIRQLKQQAASLGISESVWWPGFLSGERKAAALADADLFVLPSRSENFGIAVVEAMAASLPVVVSDQTAICREVADSRAGVVVPCDAEDLADALIRLIRRPEDRLLMGERGRETAIRKFALEGIVQQIIDAYEQILG